MFLIIFEYLLAGGSSIAISNNTIDTKNIFELIKKYIQQNIVRMGCWKREVWIQCYVKAGESN